MRKPFFPFAEKTNKRPASATAELRRDRGADSRDSNHLRHPLNRWSESRGVAEQQGPQRTTGEFCTAVAEEQVGKEAIAQSR